MSGKIYRHKSMYVLSHKAILVNAQSHLYKGTRQNMRVTKHNSDDQSFWIFFFLCVFGFLTQKQVKIDQNEQTFKAIKNKHR